MARLIRWSDWPLQGKLAPLLAILASGLAVIAWLTYAMGMRAAEAQRGVNRAWQVSEEIQKLRYSETAATAQLRGYFLSRNPAFANTVRNSIAAFEGTRLKLTALCVDNPGQLQRLSRLGEIQRSRVESISGTLARLGSQDTAGEDFDSMVLAEEEVRLGMQWNLRSMDEEQQRVLAAMLAHADSLRASMQALSWLGLILGAAGSAILWMLFSAGIARRIESLRRNVVRLADGGCLELPPYAEDEIGALSLALGQLAETLSGKTALVENAFDGIGEIELSGRYVSINRTFAEIAGISQSAPPINLLASVHGDDLAKVQAALELLRKRQRAETEARLIRPDGSVAVVILNFLPLDAHTGNRHFAFLRDITLRKETEAALVRSKDAANASNAAKTKFLAKVSHEIRTPLNAILGASDLLSQTPLNANQAEYVSMFQRNSRRLVILINDFLDFSKIEAGAVRIETLPFRVREVVAELMETFRDSAAGKKLALRVEIGPEVPEAQMGDPLRVQQVLMNLLSNALKFTSVGQVEVRVLVTGEEGAQRLRFEVADTGSGIPPAERERIFAPFTQLANQGSSDIRGSGLGLTICRELVELMQGEMGVTSTEDSGSTFHFDLPLEEVRLTNARTGFTARGEAAPVEREPARPTLPPLDAAPAPWRDQSNPIRILIADDADDNRLLMRHYLSGEGMALRFAEDGQQAIDAIGRGEHFDLILMDLDMPKVDGYKATQWIRHWQANAGVPPTPVVALSAHATQDAVRASLDSGCAAHVAKPVEKATLIKMIRHYDLSGRSRPEARRVESPVSKDIAALVPNYIASKPKQIEEAVAQLTLHDLDPIRRFGHNLKGTGRGYGFPEIEELGKALEQSATQRDEGNIAVQLEALHKFVTEAALSLTEV